MTNTAHVVKFYETGDASVLKIEEDPLPEPKEDEVRIKVKAIGLNRAEIMFRTGNYLEVPNFPSRLGYEASGTVEKVGANVDGFSVGDKVSSIPAFSMGQHGVYGDYAVIPSRALTQNPTSFNHSQSASIWMQYITAYGALVELAHITPKDTVIVTAASSSVGVAAIHLAKSIGATVIATSRSDNKNAFLLKQGADFVINTASESLVERTMEITEQQGVKLCFDPIGGPIINDLASITGQGGMIIEYGALSSDPSPFPLFPALAKGLTIRGYTIFEITQNDDKLDEAVSYLKNKFERGQLTPTIDKTFTLSQISEAHQYMESNVQMGKIVVVP